MDTNIENLPPWMNKHKVIQETAFCFWFMAEDPVKYVDNHFFTKDGRLLEDSDVRKMIYDTLSPWVETGLSRKTNDLLNVLKLEAYSSSLPLRDDRIHFANGTYFIDSGEFSEKTEFCRNRLNVNYNPDAPIPVRWNDFLFDLLELEDIPTLQEYLGYCLLPVTRGQKMLLLIGNGGEGKSRIGAVMRSIFNDSLNTTSIQKVESSPFARADLRHKLVMVDDDMDMTGLKKTNYIKSLITNEGKTDLEEKNVQSYQALIYVRFLCFGNGALTSINDTSDGFWRRQLLLTTKPKDPDRVDDTFLAEKLIEEKEGILLWMLEGLHRLIANGYRFTESDRLKENRRIAMRDINNIPSFLDSEGYILFDNDQEASTKSLYQVYRDWCDDNAENPIPLKSFAGFLASQASRYRITATNNIRIGSEKRCRGYTGIGILSRDGRYPVG